MEQHSARRTNKLTKWVYSAASFTRMGFREIKFYSCISRESLLLNSKGASELQLNCIFFVRFEVKWTWNGNFYQMHGGKLCNFGFFMNLRCQKALKCWKNFLSRMKLGNILFQLCEMHPKLSEMFTLNNFSKWLKWGIPNGKMTFFF